MKSLKAKRILIGLAITFCVVILIWFGGWVVWTQFHVWDTMQNVEYQNTLYVLMFLTVLMGSGLTIKHRVRVERPDAHVEKLEVPVQKSVDLGPINKRLDELSKKVADIHMTMKFLKKVKEKNGEKP